MEHSRTSEIEGDQNSVLSSNESISKIQWEYEDSLATARNTGNNQTSMSVQSIVLPKNTLDGSINDSHVSDEDEDKGLKSEYEDYEDYSGASDVAYEEYDSYDYDDTSCRDTENADVSIQKDVESRFANLQFNTTPSKIKSDREKSIVGKVGASMNSAGRDSFTVQDLKLTPQINTNSESRSSKESTRSQSQCQARDAKQSEEHSLGYHNRQALHSDDRGDVLNAPIAADDVNPLLLGLLSYTVSIDAKHSIVLTDYELQIQSERPRLIQDVLADEEFIRVHKSRSDTEKMNFASSLVDTHLEEQRASLRKELSRQKADLVDARRAEIERELRKLGEKQLERGKGNQSGPAKLRSNELEKLKKQMEVREDKSFDNRIFGFDPENPNDPDNLPPGDDPLEIIGWLLEKKQIQMQKGTYIESEPKENGGKEGHFPNISKNEQSKTKLSEASSDPLTASHFKSASRGDSLIKDTIHCVDSPFFPAGSSYTQQSREQANERKKAVETFSIEVRNRAARAAQRREEVQRLASCRADAERLVEDSIKNARRKTYYESFVPLLEVERSSKSSSDPSRIEQMIDSQSGLDEGGVSELFKDMAHIYPTDLHALAKAEKHTMLGRSDMFYSDQDSSTLPESRHNHVLENYNRYFIKGERDSAMSIRGCGNEDMYDLSDDELTDYKELVRIAGDAEQAQSATYNEDGRKRRVHFGLVDSKNATSEEKQRESEELRRAKHLDELAAPRHFNTSLRTVHRSRPVSARAVLRTNDPNTGRLRRLRPAWRSNLKHSALPGGVFGRPPGFGTQLDVRKRRIAHLLKESTLKAVERGEVVLRGVGSGQHQDLDTPRSGTSLCATDPSFGCTGFVHALQKPEWESRFNSPDVNMRVRIKQKMIGSPALRKGASEFDCRVYADQGSHSARHVRNVWSGGVQGARDPLTESKSGAVFNNGQGAAARLARASAASRMRSQAGRGGNLKETLGENDDDIERCSSCGCVSDEAYTLEEERYLSNEGNCKSAYGCACGCGPVRQYCPTESSASTHPGTYLISRDLLVNIQEKRRIGTSETKSIPKSVRDQYVLSKRDASLLLGIANSDDADYVRAYDDTHDNGSVADIVETPFFNKPLRDGQHHQSQAHAGRASRTQSALRGQPEDQDHLSNQTILPGIRTKELVNKWLQTMDAQVVQQTLNRARENLSLDSKNTTDAAWAWTRPETPPAPVIEAEAAAVLERVKGSSSSQPYSFNYSYYEGK